MLKLWKCVRHVGLGVGLIVAASAILLLADLDHRITSESRSNRVPHIAIVQFVSTTLLDDTVAGMRQGLAETGYANGSGAAIKVFNASGDYATANAMARDIVSGGYDLILTASTPMLQVMAKANRDSKVNHVFGAVTDPYGSGVGITGPGPDQHPPYLAGVGTFQPVAAAFDTARKMNPDLTRVGTVWNPGEHNSEACVHKAREACRRLGIELIEANAGNTSEVVDAVRSVLARGAEAVWVGGDTVAMSAIGAIISAAANAQVPVFSNDPTDVAKGALFGMGASYRVVGETCGKMAGAILHGTSPAGYRIEDLAPQVLRLNDALAKRLDGWAVPAAVARLARASAAPAALAGPKPGKTYRVGILSFAADPIFAMATQGIEEGLARRGFVVGANLELKKVHANGDMSLLPQVARHLLDDGCDLVIPLSTPCLASVCALPGDTPVVFGVVSAPLQAGAGESFERHLPHVTGAVWTAPQKGIFEWLQKLFPDCRRVGMVYNASEANSLKEVAEVRRMLAPLGMTVQTRTIANSSEISQALQSLLSGGIDAVFGMGDNTVVSAFSALSNGCRRHRVPLLADDRSLMGSGALLAVGASPAGEGRHVAELAARVLAGEDPAKIPFEPSREVETAVDFAAAAELGVALPPELLQRSEVFYNLRRHDDRPLRVVLLTLADNPSLHQAEAGVLRGLTDAGLRRGQDFVWERLSAQGEISQLPQLVDAVRTKQADLIVTVTTPALLAAARKVTDIPVVFTVASDPQVLGLFPEGQPANITGVHDDPPVDELLAMARRYDAGLQTVGTLYDPSQPNAIISVKKLRKACRRHAVGLVEASASTVSELSAGVQALVQQGAEAILISADNLTNTGFPAIVRVAQGADIPVFATEPALVKQGAAGAVGDDYAAWGAQSGLLAARVLAGVSPAALPIEKTHVQKTVPPAAPKTAAVRESGEKRPWQLRIVAFNETHFAEASRDGILEGLRRQGLQQGRDFEFRTFNAHGDIATLSSIMTAIRAEQVDLLMTITTPVLQAALRLAGDTPTVFTGVADGVRAGGGQSTTEHLPQVTGITTRSPFARMARLLPGMMPGVHRVGTLFSPGEVNSVLYKDWFEEALRAEGLELVAVPVMATADTVDATATLLSKDVEVICQIADNTTRPSFAQIARRARNRGVPVFGFDSGCAREGASVVVARDFFSAGVESAALAVRVLRGANPATIPFTNTRTEKFIINTTLARQFGLVVSPQLRKTAQLVGGERPAS